MDKQINVKVDISIKSTNINSTTPPWIISDDTLSEIGKLIREDIHPFGRPRECDLIYQKGTSIGIPKECTTKDVPVPICLIISNNVTQTCEIASQLLKDGSEGHFFYATKVDDVVQPFAKFDRVDKIFLDMRLERENRRIFTYAHSKMMLSNPKGSVIPIWINES